MAKLTLADITAITGNEASVIAAINANSDLIETAMENTLSRDGTAPNTMTANIDLNSNKVINAADPTNNQDTATKKYVDDAALGILSSDVTFGGDIIFEGSTDDAFETTLTVVDPTADRTWAIPDSSDTFVGKTTTDTLTNKALSDSTTVIVDNVDNTAGFKFTADNISTGITRTYNVVDQDDTVAFLGAAQTFVNKSFSDAIRAQTTIELGHATDTTLNRVGPGDMAIEGNWMYRAAGNDVVISDGGTGASTSAGARANLGAANSGVNTDITGMSAINGEITPATDATSTVGSAVKRFSAAYLSSGLYIGGMGAANLLDDYEEGTFTPAATLGGAAVGMTFTTQTGSYTKIGNAVSFTLNLLFSAIGSSSGGFIISGLPFTGANNESGAVWGNNLAAGATTSLNSLIIGASSELYVYKYVAGSSTQLQDTDLQNTSHFVVNGTYRV